MRPRILAGILAAATALPVAAAAAERTPRPPTRPLVRPKPSPRPHCKPYGYYWFHRPFYDPLFHAPCPPDDRDEGLVGQGNVEVRASPRNTEVYVNGMLYATRGRVRFHLPDGTWPIELRAPGYVTQTIELTVQPGVRYIIERRLEKEGRRPPGSEQKGPKTPDSPPDGDAAPASGEERGSPAR